MGKSALILLFFVLQSFNLLQIKNCNNASRLELNQTLRVDFILTGDNLKQKASLFRISHDQGWSGSSNQLISPFNYGEYRYFLIHHQSGDTLYFKGFSTLFEEWRTTNDAKLKSRAFQQTIVMPYPKQMSRLVVEGRNRDGSFSLLMDEIINPDDLDIQGSAKSNQHVKIIHGDDNPAQKADLLFISEGYNFSELDQFISDAKKVTKALIAVEPYKSLKKNFTVRTLSIASPESGVTDPLSGKYIDSYFKSRFNTFDTDRYLQTMETWKIYESAAQAAYDHIIILVNSKKYGGGGIYNHFSILTSGHKLSGDLLIHELGHGLAGLADEYFESDVAYNDYINLEIEPWQPNLTTLVDFKLKWKDLIEPTTPIPTPLRPAYKNKTGVFEGGGYVSKKVYRPAVFCKMRNMDAENFCEVCSLSISQITKFYTQ